MDIESDVSPKSLKEMVEKIFITPIEIKTLTIIKGTEKRIALLTFLGSFI